MYFCCERQRLEMIKRLGTANGIEFVEVRDHDESVQALRQRTLFVRLLRAVPDLTGSPVPLVVRIDGGTRIKEVPVEWIAAADRLPASEPAALVAGIPSTELGKTLVVRTGSAGDFSTYILRLLKDAAHDWVPDGFDPKLSSVGLSFKVECPAGHDCADKTDCSYEAPGRPVIDYLAKDYNCFRRLMLDRLNLLVPGWRERSAADIGVMLVELLAYAADNLSYRQDAIANEAYLATARRRVSVRRHARLVDYKLHEGCNARAFVQVNVTANQYTLPAETRLLTAPDGISSELPPVVPPKSEALRNAIAVGAVVFETAHEKVLYNSLNEPLDFYTWGDDACCLPRGATRGTLRGRHDAVKRGDFLALMEVRSPMSTQATSPTTLSEPDADRTKRWVVRLTRVNPDATDPSGGLFKKTPDDSSVEVTEIEWDAADALPFPLCLSSAQRPGIVISVALANLVLVDHGETMEEKLLAVPKPHERRAIPPRFRPALKLSPVTHGFKLDEELEVAHGDADWRSATALVVRDPHGALPQVTLEAAGETWEPSFDLLDCDGDARKFVVETEDDGLAALRFGDGAHGMRPAPTTEFTATYRIGNGVSGNVGADTITHIVSDKTGIFTGVTNPMAAAGGIEPESIEAARRDAPQAFRTQERAVTEADYAEAAERRADVQRAAATFRWTGSWYTAFVTADRYGGAPVDGAFRVAMRKHLERFRMAGYDLEFDAPQDVPLDIALHLCVRRDYFRSEVARAIEAELSASVLPDGRLGVFHPDRFTFGEPVYLSRILAAMQAVEGVENVRATRFEHLGHIDPMPLETGVLPMGRLEIARMDNDPNFRERGRLTIEVGGGK